MLFWYLNHEIILDNLERDTAILLGYIFGIVTLHNVSERSLHGDMQQRQNI